MTLFILLSIVQVHIQQTCANIFKYSDITGEIIFQLKGILELKTFIIG
jgi:hypothetical protein